MKNQSASLVGGKAVQLLLMQENALAVPAFFVLEAPLYAAYTLQYENNFSVETLKTFFEERQIDITRQASELGASSFAVRSSANVEDAALQSWAGQFESVLDVQLEELYQAIASCWASAQDKRVEGYLSAHPKIQTTIQVAVIIQRMIQPVTAGVAFSIHPVTKDNTQIVIESVEGLADTLVQGDVQPSLVVLDADTFSVLEEEGESFFSSALRREEVAKLVQHVQQILQTHVDIEWAIDVAQKLWLIQARPVTA